MSIARHAIQCPACGRPRGPRQWVRWDALLPLRASARDAASRRAVFGMQDYFQSDAHWRDYVPFHEYFHGDTSAGIGASHQTGWTGVIAKLIQQQGEHIERAGASLDAPEVRAS